MGDEPDDEAGDEQPASVENAVPSVPADNA